jgi:hypothetical protein
MKQQAIIGCVISYYVLLLLLGWFLLCFAHYALVASLSQPPASHTSHVIAHARHHHHLF